MLEELEQFYDTARKLQKTIDEVYEDLQGLGDELLRTGKGH